MPIIHNIKREAILDQIAYDRERGEYSFHDSWYDFWRVVDGENYQGVKDECIPNASMSIEDIYLRLAKGIPTDLSSLYSQRIESDCQKPATFDELNSYEPSANPPGTLVRLDEAAKLYQDKLAELTTAKQQQQEQQADQPAESVVEETKPDYKAMRPSKKNAESSK